MTVIGSCCYKSLAQFVLLLAIGGMQRRLSCVSAFASSILPPQSSAHHRLLHTINNRKTSWHTTKKSWGIPRGGSSSSTSKPSSLTALQLAATGSTKLSDMSPEQAHSLQKDIAKETMDIMGTSLKKKKFGNQVEYWDTSQFHQFRVLFVLGGPGAGKGTQSALMDANYPTVHLSVGELLREEQAKEDSPHKQLIEECLVAGKIVPVEISIALLEQAMQEAASAKGDDLVFLVDGFPRNFDNLEGWVRCMRGVASVWGVLVYKCPLDELERRILNRAATSGRSDDNIKSAQKRFATFERETMPVVNVMKIVQEEMELRKDEPALQVQEIEGHQSIEDVWRDTQIVMNGFVSNDVWSANAQLLNAVQRGDAEAYAKLCSPELVEGDPKKVMDINEGNWVIIDIANPKMEFVTGKKAIVSYDRSFNNEIVRETRVWSHQGTRGWVNVHFFRTPVS